LKSIIFTAATVSLLFAGCKKTAKNDNKTPDAIVSGSYKLTLAEETSDQGKTWYTVDAGCYNAGIFTFNSGNVFMYKQPACTTSADFTSTWSYDATTKEFKIHQPYKDNPSDDWWDGIIKNVTSTSFVLDETAIPNAQFNDRVTFTKQ